MRWFLITKSFVVGGLVIPNDNSGIWRGNLRSIPSPTMVTWLVDGNNLSCSRNVPNEREVILQELSKIASPRAALVGCDSIDQNNNNNASKNSQSRLPISNLVVVFDGNEEESSDRTTVDNDVCLQWTVTDGRDRQKDRADNWIVDRAIPDLHTLIDQRFSEGKGTTKVHLVSADKELQKRVKESNILNGGSIIHPPKFWKDYLPVLQEQQHKELEQQKKGG